jgi:hypothetical protein
MSFMLPALAQLHDGEQDGTVLQRIEAVPLLRDDEQISGAALPARAGRRQPHPPGEDVDGRLARILVLGQRRAGGQGDDRLAQRAGVPAVDGVGRPLELVAALRDCSLAVATRLSLSIVFAPRPAALAASPDGRMTA